MRFLLMRGLAREKRHWGDFPALLGARLGVTTTTIDLPGFGTESARLSPASIPAITDDVRARFLAERGGDHEPCMVLAISLGGMVALDWCARYPNDFVGAVVVNTSASLSSPFRRFRPQNYGRIARAVFADAVQRERLILSFTVNRTDLDTAAIAERWAVWAKERRPMRNSFARQLMAGATSPVPQQLPVPALMLASRADRLVSWTCSDVIARRLSLPLELHDSGGHDLSLDAPEWIADRVAAFVASARLAG